MLGYPCVNKGNKIVDDSLDITNTYRIVAILKSENLEEASSLNDNLEFSEYDTINFKDINPDKKVIINITTTICDDKEDTLIKFETMKNKFTEAINSSKELKNKLSDIPFRIIIDKNYSEPYLVKKLLNMGNLDNNEKKKVRSRLWNKGFSKIYNFPFDWNNKTQRILIVSLFSIYGDLSIIPEKLEDDIEGLLKIASL
jgi:hypothetical protein